MKTAIVVGHSLKKQGAINDCGVTEFQYNKKVAQFVCFNNPDADIIYRRHGYTNMINEINAVKYDLIVSLHCNAFDKKASGFEILSSGSDESMKAARIFEKNIYYDLFDEITLRGVKKISEKQRGGPILHWTKAPCILLEPFFIDNDFDLAIGIREQENYARRIIGAIEIYKESKI